MRPPRSRGWRWMAITVGAGAAWLAAPSAAADQAYSAANAQCMRSGGAAQGQTAGIIDCLNEEWARRDVVLNQVYGATMGRLAPARRAALRQDERSWLKEGTVACDHDQMEDGTIGQIEMHTCYLERTIVRIDWLRHYR